jgi:hypothetical protein
MFHATLGGEAGFQAVKRARGRFLYCALEAISHESDGRPADRLHGQCRRDSQSGDGHAVADTQEIFG